MASTIVEARGVTKDFGTVQAVKGVDLDIAPGELFGLIGHNGAGKSTLFKMMLGLIPVTHGTIRLDGESVSGPRFRETRRKIGYLPENVVLYDNLTGLETLFFFADLKAVPRRECAGLLEKVGLSHAAGRRVREYSKGMRQRLGFAQALLGTPRLLFLDEPTTGLDPGAIRDFYRILRELKAQGVTMVLTSHILAEIQERVDRLAVMEGGLIRAMTHLAYLYYTGTGVPLDYRRAEAWYRRAARTEDPWARNDLAWFLAVCPDNSFHDGEMAVDYARSALEKMTKQDYQVVDTMAAALARSGKFGEAMQLQMKALVMFADDKEKDYTPEERAKLEKELQDRLDHYKKQKAFVEKNPAPEGNTKPLVEDRILQEEPVQRRKPKSEPKGGDDDNRKPVVIS